MEACKDCVETQRLTFAMKGVKLEVNSLQHRMSDRDIEHDTIIQGINTQMHNMEAKFTELRDDVKQDIKSIKDEIPAMFEAAINRLMARVLRWILYGILACALIVVVAFARPYAAAGLKELYDRVQEMEVE